LCRLFHDPTQKNPHWLLEDEQNNEPYSDLGSLPTEDIADAAGAHFAEGDLCGVVVIDSS
jgi:hypothetical protein